MTSVLRCGVRSPPDYRRGNRGSKGQPSCGRGTGLPPPRPARTMPVRLHPARPEGFPTCEGFVRRSSPCRCWWSSPAAGARCPDPPRRSRTDGPPWFEDVTESGPRLRPRRRARTGDATSCRRSSAPGAALFDFDGDGRLDIYLLHNGGPDRPDEPALPPEARRHLRATSAPARAWTSPATAWASPSATSTTTAGPTSSLTAVRRLRLFLNQGDGQVRAT